jgi:alkane 1-monooxygenase
MLNLVSRFTLVTILPTLLLALAAMKGGYWPLIPLALLLGVNNLVDQVFPDRVDSPIEAALNTALPITLAFAHFALLALALWALAIKPDPLTTKIPLFFAFSIYFGSLSNGVAHELIHRSSRFQFFLGKWIFISHLFGHHTSAHRLVHHPYVATSFDPNTARYNESFYKFFTRAWRGSFLAGLSAENVRRGYPPESRAVDLANPYFTYIVGAALFLGLAAGFAGFTGLIVYLLLAFMAQSGLLLTDYIQHYGLTRSEDSYGKFEPVRPHHSWNSSHWFTRHFTLNAPLHSDHHTKPAKPYTDLRNYPSEIAPQLPYGPALMSIIALSPKRWRKIMNVQVAQNALLHRKHPTS